MKKLSETKFFTGLDRHSNVPDKVVVILLAFIPLLQHYKGVMGLVASTLLSNILPAHYVDRADNMAISLMIILAPYLALRILPRLNKQGLKGALLLAPLMAFFVFKIVDHGTSIVELLQVALILFYLLALAVKVIDLKTLVKSASLIAGIAGVLMIAQYICFYGLKFHLQLVPTSLLMPSGQQWIGLAKTGLISVNGIPSPFYRPSAIFLEPSHLFLYSFPALFINLYQTKKRAFNWAVSVFASLGIVLSTSGMGVATVFGAWVLFALLWDAQSDTMTLKGLMKWQNWLWAAGVALVLLAVFLLVPSINSSIARIVGLRSIELFPSDGAATMPELPDNLEEFLDDKNAVSGRVTGALGILKGMNLKQWIIGCADSTAGTDTNMPGFMSIAYKYGIIGLVLSYAFFLYCLKKVNADYFWYVVIWFFASLFSTHTHGMIFMLFYVMVLCRGCQEADGSWQKELLRPVRFLRRKK